MSNFITT